MYTRIWILMVLFLWMGIAPLQAAGPASPVWHETDASGAPVVHLYFFWTSSCPHCREARPFIDELEQRHPWLQVHSHELMRGSPNVDLYISMAKQLGQEASSVPAFLFCESMRTGFDKAHTSGRELEAALIACRDRMPKADANKAYDEPIRLPVLGEIDPAHHSLPVLTLLIAGLDAFNPCAFFVLLFLLSLLIRGRSRARMAVIGGLFVFFSGLMYFLFMAAWLNLFLMLGELAVITTAAGVIAVVLGAVNIKDFFYFGRGISLSIPESAKPGLFQKMRGVVEAGRWPAMVASTAILAIAANSYELLCTAGFPMIYTRILTMSGLGPLEHYLYLAFYNLVYVIPLLVIVSVFVWTMGARKLGEKEGRVLKLMSGLMMLGLGGLLVFAPQLLNNVAAAALLIAGSLALTALLAWWPRSRPG